MKVAIVGLGKIATDQHLPVIADNPDFDLAAVVSRRGLTSGGAAGFTSLTALLEADIDIDAVALCTPPRAHYAAARQALLAGKHVLLEKPPTVTLAEMAELERLAATTGRTLFATWHSRFNPAVEQARAQLSDRRIGALTITWKEDVRRWHPGQAWIWEPGGFGVFDPGINALSILTAIVPSPVFVRGARLEVPSNRRAPIAAAIDFSSDDAEADISAEFDWRQTGPQTWRIDIKTADGALIVLDNGGRCLTVDGTLVVEHGDDEYAAIYRRFADLIATGSSDVDAAPLRLVADAFLLASHATVAPFGDEAKE